VGAVLGEEHPGASVQRDREVATAVDVRARLTVRVDEHERLARSAFFIVCEPARDDVSRSKILAPANARIARGGDAHDSPNVW
jgi:hypothetical protein